MFVNNPLSGLIIFAGLILQNYWWALNGFVGTLFATISALILQQNRFENSNSYKIDMAVIKSNVQIENPNWKLHKELCNSSALYNKLLSLHEPWYRKNVNTGK